MPGRGDILGVVLAGGLSRRMGGGDKGLLPLGGGTLIGAVVARLAPQCGGLAVNANGDAARFAALGLPVVADGIPGHPGPLAGILAGMDHAAARGFGHVLTVPADTPFLPADLALRLAGALSADHPVALAATAGGGRHPAIGLWPAALRGALRAAVLSGVAKVGLWAGEQGAAYVPFPADPVDPFFNVNTPEDLAEARRLAAQEGRDST